MPISRYKKDLEKHAYVSVRLPIAEVEEIDSMGADLFRSRAQCVRYLIHKGLEAEKKALEARESNSSASTATV